jgi:hypothetical protein
MLWVSRKQSHDKFYKAQAKAQARACQKGGPANPRAALEAMFEAPADVIVACDPQPQCAAEADSGKTDGGKRGPGAPVRDAVFCSKQHWEAFNVAAVDQSIYFGNRASTFLRGLGRWITNTKKGLETMDDDKKPPIEYALKQLGIMEQAVRLHRLWVSRSTIDRVLQEFLQQWHLLKAFAESPPYIKLECGFLFDLVMQVWGPQFRHLPPPRRPFQCIILCLAKVCVYSRWVPILL